MLIKCIITGRYFYLLCFVFFWSFNFSCKTSSKQMKNSHFSPSPTERSTVAKITSHYNTDSLLLLFLTYLPKAHFEIALVRNKLILTEPKQRSKLYYKYRIEVSDGKAIVSGKLQEVPSINTKPSSSESFWNVIKFGEGGIINARAIEDVKIISGAMDDAVITYNN